MGGKGRLLTSPIPESPGLNLQQCPRIADWSYVHGSPQVGLRKESVGTLAKSWISAVSLTLIQYGVTASDVYESLL